MTAIPLLSDLVAGGLRCFTLKDLPTRPQVLVERQGKPRIYTFFKIKQMFLSFFFVQAHYSVHAVSCFVQAHLIQANILFLRVPRFDLEYALLFFPV